MAMHAASQCISTFYLRQVETAHAVALERFLRKQSSVDSIVMHAQATDTMLCTASAWWLRVLRALPRVGDQTAVMHMIDRLRARVLSFGSKWGNAFASRFRDAHGLSLALANELAILEKKRRSIYRKLRQKSDATPTRNEIDESGNCKKCREARDGLSCWHCRFYNELEGFRQHFLGLDNTFAAAKNDRLLFEDATLGDVEEDDDVITQHTEVAGTSAATSLFIVVFRELALGARAIHGADGSLLLSVHEAHDHVQEESELWARLMREWMSAKKLFQAQHQRLGALDELEMARMQIRLREPSERVMSAADKIYKLEAFEVPLKRAAFEAELVIAESELAQHRSQLRYLRHLQSRSTRAPTNDDEDSTDEVCVVCLEAMAEARAVLPCAHTLCTKCLDRLSTTGGRRSTQSIRCPTCRRRYHQAEARVLHQDAAALAQRQSHTQWLQRLREQSALQVADRGVQLLRSGFGCKLDLISRRLLALARANPTLKALVFTQWVDMMDVVTAALSQNAVTCFKYTSKRQFPRVLQTFKLCPEPCVLVLPFKVGANGLNIIEATEVLLLEPLVNTSIEAQAINRVHRIGQTKCTRVHRFVVGDSIEERIHWLSRHQVRVQQELARAGEENQEGEDGISADDSLVVKRNEQERMTLSTLRALLNDDRTDYGAEVDGSEDTSEDHASRRMHSFWRQNVMMDGRSLARKEALQLLERRHAAETRATCASISISTRDEASLGTRESVVRDPHTQLLGVDVKLMVAHELLSLKESVTPANAASTTDKALLPLVEMHRARVEEEIREWKAASNTRRN
ncbi:hypothetical protein PINS_up014759 [Pythium insidiosum]|nr:hypothetical protein PINS_up014759 [Pythium insidiosum]